MRFQRYGKFTGGIDLPQDKEATIDGRITPTGWTGILRVPLAPTVGPVSEPCVEPGQFVHRGERIAVGPADGLDVFAPLSGTVGEPCEAAVAARRGRYACPAVAIEVADELASIAPADPSFDWRAASPQVLRDRLADGHLVQRGAFPRRLVDWLGRALDAGEWLVLNAVEDQPLVTSGHRLLVEYGREVTAGLAILAKAAQMDHTVLAIDQEFSGDYGELWESADEMGVQRVAVERKYPVGADAILLKVLTRREIPCGGRPDDIGAAVIDASTCLAAYRWIACGERIDGRVVTVAGEWAAESGNRFVPIGAACGEVLGAVRGPITHNGPMVGQVVDAETVVTTTTSAVLGMTPTAPGPSVQCIRCGWCRDHCPTRLNVAMLNDCYELGQIETAEGLGVLSCVGCGVCSYVCPARLPLRERMQRLCESVIHRGRAMPLFQQAPVGKEVTP